MGNLPPNPTASRDDPRGLQQHLAGGPGKLEQAKVRWRCDGDGALMDKEGTRREDARPVFERLQVTCEAVGVGIHGDGALRISHISTFSPVPQGAAPPRGLSGSSTMRRRPWRPPLQIFVSRGSGSMRPTVPIPDPAASERGLSNSRATCPRPSWPPLRGLASRGSGSMRPTVLIPDPAASERGLSNSIATRHRSRWPPLRSLASRGSVRDCLRSPATTRPSRGSVYTTVPFPDRAALARSLSYSTET
ncbi:hypothetical protein EDB83DRAFT_2557521 [Lactarius deliciosus]|nr:hypothetical protein EDB83DRAFT_2557521 [Lactarius deliciosus]